MDILVKTMLGMENVVAARIKEIDPDALVVPSPRGFKGLVLVKSASVAPDELYQRILEEVIEADTVIRIMSIAPASPRAIAEAAATLAPIYISPDESFAVRTTRRGRHDFTSIDVNVIVGDAVRRATGASVNLSYPDRVVLVEIIGGEAYISIVPGSFLRRKKHPSKKELVKIFGRFAVVQMPYLGPRESIMVMGRRIGREVQNFEVAELVVAPVGITDAAGIAVFINSVIEGIESRYEIQRRSYSRRPRRVRVYLQDLHQLVRDRMDEAIIVFEPEGKYIGDAAEELASVIKRHRRINLLFGSREGIPPGIYRYADMVIDVAPGITLSTDYAAAAGLIALATVLYNWLDSNESRDTGGGERDKATPGNRDKA